MWNGPEKQHDNIEQIKKIVVQQQQQQNIEKKPQNVHKTAIHSQLW